jgi:hypothetical protein
MDAHRRVGLLAVMVLLAAVHSGCPTDHAGVTAADGSWVSSIHAVDDALARGDARGAILAWSRAVLVAHGTRRWEAMAAVGDAALRISAVPGGERLALADARAAWQAAFFRARADRSVAGLVRVAESFATIGDLAATERCLAMARRITGDDPVGQAGVDTGSGRPRHGPAMATRSADRVR